MALSFNYQGEEQLKASGMAYTILRPASFMQNFPISLFPRPSRRRVPCTRLWGMRAWRLSTRDIGEVAVAVLTSAGHEGARPRSDRAGGSHLFRSCGKISAATGRPVPVHRRSGCGVRASADEHRRPSGLRRRSSQHLRPWSPTVRGKSATVSSAVSEILGRPARSFDEFAREHAAYFLP